MDAKKFLQDKGVYLKEGDVLFNPEKGYKYIVGSNEGQWELSDLLEEYAMLKAHDIMVMKNK